MADLDTMSSSLPKGKGVRKIGTLSLWANAPEMDALLTRAHEQMPGFPSAGLASACQGGDGHGLLRGSEVDHLQGRLRCAGGQLQHIHPGTGLPGLGIDWQKELATSSKTRRGSFRVLSGPV